MSRMTPELVHQAVINASRKHMCKNEVIEFLQDKEMNTAYTDSS